MPPARISAASAGATTSPASTPMIDASRPIANVSISTEFRICPRDAPSTRSNANSLVRCATVTVNVLKIKKPPTSSATPAKISSAIRMKPSALGEVLRLLLGGLLARAHEEVASELACDTAALTVSGVLPAGRDRDRVVAVVPGHALRLGQRHRDHLRAAEAVLAADRRDAGHRVLLGRRAAGDGRLVADLEVELLRRAAVERDLVGRRGRRALLVVQDLEDRSPCSQRRSASAGPGRRSPRPACRAACRRS